MRGIRSELPACHAFADALPAVSYAGMTYRFNFLRLSLVRQSADPAFHLDSDAATALTGDVGSLGDRAVLRLLLNLSAQQERALHYLGVDPRPSISSPRGRTSVSKIPRGCRHARASRLSRRARGRSSTAWPLRRIGCCIPGSTGSADTSSRPTAWRRQTVPNGLTVGEHREEAVAECALSGRGEGPVPVDPLVQLARPPAAATPVRQGEVVEDEQVARSQGDLDLDCVDVEPEEAEEAQLGSEIVELHPTQEAGRGLDARESRRAGGALEHACQAALGIAVGVIPRAV